MFSIEKTDYGLKIVMSGLMQPDEMNEWLKSVGENVTPGEFGVMLDIRELQPLPDESMGILNTGRSAARQAGMTRAAGIAPNADAKAFFTAGAKEAGIYDFEKYVDSSDPNWEQIALDWIINGVSPDK